MNILSVNKYFFLKGGAETYYFSLNRLLQDKGYHVTTFSMKDQRNQPSPFENYFVDSIDYNEKNILKKVQYTSKVIYSVEARKKIGRLIRDSNPNLAHLQNFYHQLSPSILKEIKKYHLPIVFTAHDLKLLCPNYQMLCKGDICEKCREHQYVQCVLNRCMKDSTAASLVSMTEMYLHHALRSFDNIDIIITPSAFYKKKFIEFGFSSDKIVHIPNFIDTLQYKPNYCSNGYIAYFGRLSREKGILTLIKAMKYLRNIELYIIGDGPLRSEIEMNIEEAGMTNVKLLGFKSGETLDELIRNCYLIVLPSEWYENAPLSVLEAMAFGKPVIGADTGGIPELVQHGRTGLIFEPKNSEQLSEQLNDLCTNPQKAINMGIEARRTVERNFSREEHFEKIDGIYNKLLMKHN
jgi:glycosyltransferase involved in cell wall biosynthesis